MLACKESEGTVQRNIFVTIKPTVTEIAEAIRSLDASEQIALLGCLDRRFCRSEEGLMQLAFIADELDKTPTEKATEAKRFVECLASYVLGVTK